MNCKRCKKVLFYGQKICECGEKVPVFTVPAPRPMKDYMPNSMDKEFGTRLTEINAYVEKFQIDNSGATKRIACLSYMQERGIKLPSYVESQKEFNEERQAIKSESFKELENLNDWDIPF